MKGGSSQSALARHSSALRAQIYGEGSDEDLLLGDVLGALILKRFSISARNVLGQYSENGEDEWEHYFLKEGSVTEFWPSQIRLAESGVFQGKSVVVQMPTSAGKTRSIELIIRNYFLAARGDLAIVVAPYRALCQEIFNDFIHLFGGDANIQVSLVSDVLQREDLRFIAEANCTVLILTPEKLELLTRYDRALSEKIGLIIYDEGHLFDNGSRGSKYELLLSSLKLSLPEHAQVVLMSAVISNASEVSNWLLGQGGSVIDGRGLSPTSRNIAFVDWSRRNRNLQFVDERNIDKNLFFVPSVLRSYPLERRDRERRARYFPDLGSNGLPTASQVSGFLACRLAGAGLSAVFVGQKKSAVKIARDIVDAFERNVSMQRPLNFSGDGEAAAKVTAYIEKILGEQSINAKASALGVLMHHAGVPHGLKLVTEHALLRSQFKIVICTSTLAQGINLPIRYLIVSTMWQGGEGMKTRDFHNLMGRAGRSGWYTEGTVIFANPEIYKDHGTHGPRWTEIDYILDSENSEPSRSLLHLLLDEVDQMSPHKLEAWLKEVAAVTKTITSYLTNALANVDQEEEAVRIARELSSSTLGYFQLESEGERERLASIFVAIAVEILRTVPDLPTRAVFAKSFLTLEQSSEFVSYLQWNAVAVSEYLASNEDLSVLEFFWGFLYGFAADEKIKRFDEDQALILCKKWIAGDSLTDILESAADLVEIAPEKMNMMDIVALCEHGFGYEISAIFGSLSELSKLVLSSEDMDHLEPISHLIQQCLKFGVPGDLEAAIYQLGFSDRALSMEIANDLGEGFRGLPRFRIIAAIRNSDQIERRLNDDYPEYFYERLRSLKQH